MARFPKINGKNAGTLNLDFSRFSVLTGKSRTKLNFGQTDWLEARQQGRTGLKLVGLSGTVVPLGQGAKCLKA